MTAAWEAVVRRRYAYFATVWLTVVLAVLPPAELLPGRIFRLPSELITAIGDVLRHMPLLSTWLPWAEGWLSFGVSYIPSFVGGWTKIWADWYQKHPLFFFIAALVLAWLFFRKSAQLQDEAFARADFAWRRIRPSAPSTAQSASVTNPIVHLLRESTLARRSYQVLTGRIIPLLLSVPIALIGVVFTIFYIPKFSRLARLRHKYKVGRTAAKPGTDEIVPVERNRCPDQP